MVKRDLKSKIEIKKITNKNSLATSFTKRRHGLYIKASQLCLLTDAQIAILATPSSFHSNVSFYSFGHSSVEAVVSAFLSGECLAPVSITESKEMREDLGVCMGRSDLGLGHWWDDDERFKNPQDIMEAIESIESLLSHVRRLRTKDAINFKQREALVVRDDEKNKDMNNMSDLVLETDQTLTTNTDDISAPAAGNLDEWSDMDLDQLIDFDDENQTQEEGEEDHQISENLCSNNYNALLTENQTQEEEDHHQIVAVSEYSCSNNNALGKMADEFAATFLM